MTGTFSTEAQDPVASSTRNPALIIIGDAANGGAPPPAAERIKWIGERGLTIGRTVESFAGGPDGVWTLTHRRASGLHARVRRGQGLCILEDLGSTNGTLQNGTLLRGPVPLADGDVLFFGGHAAVFRWLSGPDREALASAQRAPLTAVATASPALASAEQRLRRLAQSTQEILLVGETGVGKEVYAEAVHALSGRSGALIAVNCAALPHDLVESELFGYVRGAHSQANATKRGLIEEADGGTLFLDELGDMPMAAQAKLLRFLQTRELMALGATRSRLVDVRFVAATSRPAGGDGSPGLRDDLLGRLGAAAFTLPPVRARREDIGALASFLQIKGSGGLRPIDPLLFLAMCLYPWPRNVRELKKVVETAVLLAGNETEWGPAHVPADIIDVLTVAGPREPRSDPLTTTAPAMPAVRRRSPRPIPPKEELEALMATHRGNMAEVARALDRDWKVIKRAIERHGIDVNRFRG